MTTASAKKLKPGTAVMCSRKDHPVLAQGKRGIFIGCEDEEVCIYWPWLEAGHDFLGGIRDIARKLGLENIHREIWWVRPRDIEVALSEGRML